MDQAESRKNPGTWLRRAWIAALRTADAMAMGRSPVEELFERIDRLEREVAALNREGAAPACRGAAGHPMPAAAVEF